MFHHSYKMDASWKCCISGQLRHKCRRPLCHSFPLTLFLCSSVCPSHWLESFTESSFMGSSPRATAPVRNLLQHRAASFRPLHMLQLPSGHDYLKVSKMWVQSGVSPRMVLSMAAVKPLLPQRSAGESLLQHQGTTTTTTFSSSSATLGSAGWFSQFLSPHSFLSLNTALHTYLYYRHTGQVTLKSKYWVKQEFPAKWFRPPNSSWSCVLEAGSIFSSVQQPEEKSWRVNQNIHSIDGVSSLPLFRHLANSSYKILNQCVLSLQLLLFPISMAWEEKDNSTSINYLQSAFALVRGGPKNFPPYFIQRRENSSSTCFMEHAKWKQINMTALSIKNEQSYRYHVLSHMPSVPVWQFSGFQHMPFVCTNHLQETCPVMQQTEIT